MLIFTSRDTAYKCHKSQVSTTFPQTFRTLPMHLGGWFLVCNIILTPIFRKCKKRIGSPETSLPPHEFPSPSPIPQSQVLATEITSGTQLSHIYERDIEKQIAVTRIFENLWKLRSQLKRSQSSN